MFDQKQLEIIAANSAPAKEELEYLASERHLIDFMKYGWSQLEPGRPFEVNWQNHAICEHLEAVTNGDIRFLLMNVPPGSTKSMTTSVFWHAWEWGPMKMPFHRFIKTSYATKLATRDNVRSRDLLKSDWFQKRWPTHFKHDNDGKTEFENLEKGWSMSASSGAMLTGFRGDRIIVDDPHSVQSAESEARREEVLYWFTETLPTRFNDSNKSAIVVIMQRLHEADVSGLILAKELGYEHLMIPMEFEPQRRCYSVLKPSYMDSKLTPVVYNSKEHCWQDRESATEWVRTRASKDDSDNIPDDHIQKVIDEWETDERYSVDPRVEDGDLMHPARFNREAIDTLKKSLSAKGGTYAIAGQLQQRPVPRGGGMFKQDDFRYMDRLPEGVIEWCRGWDFAASDKNNSPYTVGVMMGKDEQDRYIINCTVRGRWTPGEVESNIKKTVKQDDEFFPQLLQSMPQDPGQAGKVQKRALGALLAGYNFTFSPESGSKEDRARPLAAQAEAGNLFLVRGPWNDDFVTEATSFPNGLFKDQVDAASRAFGELVHKEIDDGDLGIAPILIGVND